MAPAERDAELALTARVGRELVRLRLGVATANARGYYSAIRDGRTPDRTWSHDMNIEWLRMLRLPPHEHDYPVRPRMSACAACEISRTFTRAVFPGGTLSACACGARWLELHDG